MRTPEHVQRHFCYGCATSTILSWSVWFDPAASLNSVLKNSAFSILVYATVWAASYTLHQLVHAVLSIGSVACAAAHDIKKTSQHRKLMFVCSIILTIWNMWSVMSQAATSPEDSLLPDSMPVGTLPVIAKSSLTTKGSVMIQQALKVSYAEHSAGTASATSLSTGQFSVLPALPLGSVQVFRGEFDLRGNRSCALNNQFTSKILMKTCSSPIMEARHELLQLKVNMHLDARDLLQAAFREAWGKQPPSVDLYLRLGCHDGGLQKIAPLVQSIELFWPSFLGKVVVVMDDAPQQVHDIVPRDSVHQYEFHTEVLPDHIPTKASSQYSYMHADLHCNATYIVVLQSDTVLLSPVLPSLLFTGFGSQQERVRLVRHQQEQENDSGNRVVVMPIAFRTDTLSNWRNSASRPDGCLAARMPRLLSETFCWTCEVGSWIEQSPEELSKYEVIRPTRKSEKGCDPKRHQPVYRGIHASLYESLSMDLVIGGLCKSLGPKRLPQCERIVGKTARATGVALAAKPCTSNSYDFERLVSHAEKILASSPLGARPRSL